MNFSSIQSALIGWIETSTGVNALWANQVRPSTPRPFATLQFTTAPVRIGTDAVTYDEVGSDPDIQLQPVVSGARQITVRVVFFSRDQRQGYDSIHFADLAQTSIRRPGIYQTISDAGLGLSGITSLPIGDVAFDNRIESIASLDVTFNAISSTSHAVDVTDYVDKAEITCDELGIEDETFGNV